MKKSIQGTRSFHSFKPISTNTIIAKRVSLDKEGQTFKISNRNEGVSLNEFHQGMFVACVYDREWFIGVILETNSEHNNIKVKFMSKGMKTNSFSWPTQ